VADEVRLHLVLLDEVLVAVEIDPPIDVLGVVAGAILAMARELDREPGEGRLVGPGQVADHEPARLDEPVGDGGEHVGIEIAGEDVLGHGCFANDE
jgi:hypothetical protein